MANVIKLEDLINQKEKILNSKQEKTALLHIKSLNANIRITKPDAELVNGCREMDAGEGDAYLVYNCVVEPNLKDAGLQEAYECVEPVDIVGKVFEDGETALISRKIVKLGGYLDSVKEIKN